MTLEIEIGDGPLTIILMLESLRVGDGGEPCKGWSRPPLSQQLTKNRPLHLTVALAQQTGSKLGQELPD